jgi:hypothetical protein
MVPTGSQFASYDSRKLDRLLNQQFWADCIILYKSGFWRNFAMTALETLYTKNVSDELSFPLVTHMTCFNTWLFATDF